MSVHSRKDIEKLSALARDTFSVSHMSDTKWRKLIALLGTPEMVIEAAEVKIFDADDIMSARPPAYWGLNPPKPWVEIGGWPCELNAIHWAKMIFQAEIDKNDIQNCRARIEAVGQFRIDWAEDSFTIYGYE